MKPIFASILSKNIHSFVLLDYCPIYFTLKVRHHLSNRIISALSHLFLFFNVNRIKFDRLFYLSLIIMKLFLGFVATIFLGFMMNSCIKHEVIPPPIATVDLNSSFEAVINGTDVEWTQNVEGYKSYTNTYSIYLPSPQLSRKIFSLSYISIDMVVLVIFPNKFEKITLSKNNFAFSLIVELDEIIANFFV